MAKIKLAIGNYSGDFEKRLEYVCSGSVFDIFSNAFMQKYTKHDNFTDFCQAINCDMTSQNDLVDLDSGKFDDFIRVQSDFESWEDMAETAFQLQIKKN